MRLWVRPVGVGAVWDLGAVRASRWIREQGTKKAEVLVRPLGGGAWGELTCGDSRSY